VILSVMVLMPCQVFAAKVYIDGIGNYGSYGDANKMIGYGGGVGFELIPRIDLYTRFYHAADSKTRNGEKIEEYQEDTWFVCADYKHQLGLYPLYWTTSIGVGPSRVRIRNVDWLPDNDEKQEMGVFFGLWTGIKYNFSQSFGLFGLVGYQRTSGFKADLSGSKIGGFQMVIGVTATIVGNNSRIDQGY